MEDDQKARDSRMLAWVKEKSPGWTEHVAFIREQITAIGERGFESIKHMTTLSAGSVVLIATFMDKIFPEQMRPITMGFITVSFLSFGLALILSVFYMNRYVNVLPSAFVPSRTETHNLTLDPDDDWYPQDPELKALLIEVSRFTEENRTLAKILRSLKAPYRWTSVCFTLGILTFGTAILENMYLG